MDGSFQGVGVEDQLDALERRALDESEVITSPFPSLNLQLHKGGLHGGNLVVLGGRMGTRKTAVILTWVIHSLRKGLPVGLLSLDESLEMYVSKLMSVMSQRPSEWLEENWLSKPVRRIREEYAELATNLTLSRGVRPTAIQLQEWLSDAEIERAAPRIVFLDYTSLLVHYHGHENERILRLFEDLQVWTHDNDLVTVALHQAGRKDEGVTKKYHGDSPMTAEGLLYGGEQQADVILATYRPALNQIGNMSREQAEMILGDTFDQEKWEDARAMVRRYARSTFLQLLKNRPSTKGTNFGGVELISPNDSQFLQEHGEGVGNDAEWQGEE